MSRNHNPDVLFLRSISLGGRAKDENAGAVLHPEANIFHSFGAEPAILHFETLLKASVRKNPAHTRSFFANSGIPVPRFVGDTTGPALKANTFDSFARKALPFLLGLLLVAVIYNAVGTRIF